jgi:hypothetical protein
MLRPKRRYLQHSVATRLFQTGLFGACRYRALIRVEYTEVISLAARTGFHAADADHRVD